MVKMTKIVVTGFCIVLLSFVPGFAHTAKASSESLVGLKEGTTVTLQFRPECEDVTSLEHSSDEDLMMTEGTVVRVNREKKQITVAYDDGTADVFQLVERITSAAWPEAERAIVSRAAGANVIVRYTDEDGRKAVHFFKPAR